MIKKISALIIALTMCAAMFSGCGKSSSSDADSSSDASSVADSSSTQDSSAGDASSTSDSSSSTTDPAQTAGEPSLTIDGKKIDVSNFTMLTIDGVDVDFATFRYFYFYTVTQFTQSYGADLNTIKNIQGGFEDLLKQTVNNIKNSRMVVDAFAKENNITLNDDDKKAIEKNFEETKAQFSSEDEYKAQLKSAHLTEDILKTNIQYSQLTNKVSTTLFTNEGKYATKKADFKNIVKDNSKYACELHIMIPFITGAEVAADKKDSYDSMTLENKINAKQEAYSALDEAGKEKAKAAAKATAEEALKKAVAGESFTNLIKTYGWDTTLASKTDGYYLTKDNTDFPSEIVEKAFSLKENEVAKDIIENENYGFFIIKRIPVNMEYVEKNIEAMILQYDQPNINKIILERSEKLTVKYCDGWDKLTIDSIT